MKRLMTITATLLFAGSFMAACGGSNDKSTVAGGDGTTPPTVTSTGGAGGGGATLTLVATDIAFDKSSLTAKADEPLTIKIENKGKIPHNITVEDLKVSKDVEGGQSAEQTVTPAAGTYQYHCEYHPEAMKGTLTVS